MRFADGAKRTEHWHRFDREVMLESLQARGSLQRRRQKAAQAGHATGQRRFEREWLGLEVVGGVLARCLGE